MSRLDEALARLERAVARLEAAFAGAAPEDKRVPVKADLDRVRQQLGAVFGESGVTTDGPQARGGRAPQEKGDE